MFPCLSVWLKYCMFVCLSICLCTALYFEQSHAFAIVKFGDMFHWLPLHSLLFWVVSSFMAKIVGRKIVLVYHRMEFRFWDSREPLFRRNLLSHSSCFNVILWRQILISVIPRTGTTRYSWAEVQFEASDPPRVSISLSFTWHICCYCCSHVFCLAGRFHAVITRNGSVWPWP